MDINAHHAIRMRAEACHGPAADWVDITITERAYSKTTESTITVFLDSARKADAYANAINAADAEFHTNKVTVENVTIGASA